MRTGDPKAQHGRRIRRRALAPVGDANHAGAERQRSMNTRVHVAAAQRLIGYHMTIVAISFGPGEEAADDLVELALPLPPRQVANVSSRTTEVERMRFGSSRWFGVQGHADAGEESGGEIGPLLAG